MADGPALALQVALVAALEAAPAVAALVEDRVYDEPLDDVTTPYLRVGDMDVRPLRSDGAKAWGVTFAVDVHSRPLAGRVEATRAAEAIVDVLDDDASTLTVAGHRVAWIDFITFVVRREADGKTYGGRVVFDALLEPTA